MRTMATNLACIMALSYGAAQAQTQSLSSQFQNLLSEIPGDGNERTIFFNNCDLIIVSESVGQRRDQISLVRSTLEVDLRNYQISNWRLSEGAGYLSVIFQINESPTYFFDDLDLIFQAAEDHLGQSVSVRDGLKDSFGTEFESISYQVQARIVRTEGEQILLPHADAGNFQRFMQALEDDESIRSFSAVGAFAEEYPREDTLLFGSVSLVTQLEFRVDTMDAAQQLSEFLMGYARANSCLE